VCDLIEFLGYGSTQPAVVFLGIEESDGGGGISSWRIREAEFNRVEDMYEACAHKLAKAGVDPYARPGNPVRVWNRAAEFRLALAGDEPPYRGWEQYWRASLGRRHGDTFLMECFHLPRRGRQQVVGEDPAMRWPERLRLLRRFTDTIAPRYIVAYGAEPCRLAPSVFNVTVGDASVELDRRRGIVLARVGFFGQGHFGRSNIGGVAKEMLKLGGGPIPK
jgi:hypothetical protein